MTELITEIVTVTEILENNTIEIVESINTTTEIVETSEVVSLTVNHNYLEENDFILTAGENIGGHKVVYLKENKAFLADKNNPECFNKVVGMSSNAATTNGEITVKKATRITLDGWGLTPDKLYLLGNDGNITETSNDGIFQIIGIAKDSNTLLIQISNPIFRA